MNICFLCNEYPPATHGGIGRATRTLAQSLVESGHQVRVIGFTFLKEPVSNLEWDCGVAVHRLKFATSRFGWIRARRALFRTVSDWAHSGEIDLVEAPDYEGLVAGWPTLPVPVIARLHGSSAYFSVEMGKRPNWKTLLLERASLRRADFRCSCSRYTAEKTQRLFHLRGPIPTVLHNTVEVPQTLSSRPRSPNTVVFTGTLAAKKGIVSLIHAWRIVSQQCPNAELHVFGKDGRTDSGESMQRYLQSLLPPQAFDSVRFHGHVELARLRSAFQSAGVAVFPSFSEAFALAPMEAMAEGCPTIYSRRSSGAELISDGENGLLVDPDDPRGIAAAIVRLMEDSAVASKLGKTGRKTIEDRFSPSALAPQNIDFYSQCIQLFHAPALENSAQTYHLSQRVSK